MVICSGLNLFPLLKAWMTLGNVGNIGNLGNMVKTKSFSIPMSAAEKR